MSNKHQRYPPETREWAAQQFVAGISYRYILSKTGMSTGALYAILHEQGVDIKAVKRAAKGEAAEPAGITRPPAEYQRAPYIPTSGRI